MEPGDYVNEEEPPASPACFSAGGRHPEVGFDPSGNVAAASFEGSQVEQEAIERAVEDAG